MNENQRKFFTTNYSEVPRRRIWVYAIIVVSAFSILGLMTNQNTLVLVGAGVAIIIPIFGRFLDYGKTNPPAMRVLNKIYAVIAVTFVILVLALIVVPSIVRMLKQL